VQAGRDHHADVARDHELAARSDDEVVARDVGQVEADVGPRQAAVVRLEDVTFT
jgi:hypothetical protein